MRSLRIMLIVALAVGIVAAPAAASGAPLSAPMAAGVRAEVPPDGYVPSKSKWRSFMINVTGSLLGQSMPAGWRREQAANRFAQNGLPSADALNQMYGYTDLIEGPYGNLVSRAPRGSGTYDDVVADEMERRNNGTSTRRGMQVPATWGKPIVKSVGGAATAFLGLEMGTSLGAAGMNMVGGWFGWDVNGTVCSQTADQPGGELTAWVTGQDCSAWSLADGYEYNEDWEAVFGAATWNGGSVRYLGGVSYTNPPNPTAYGFCYSLTHPVSYTNEQGQSVGLHFKRADNGAWSFTTLNTISANPTGIPLLCKDKGGNGYITSSAAQPAYWNSDKLLWFMTRSNFVPQGTAPTVPDEDPERTQSCEVTFTDGSKATSTGDPYRESEGVVKPVQCPPTPAGKTPATISVGENVGGERRELYREDTTDAFREWNDDHPECATGVCLLDLVIETAPGTYASCFDLEEGCAGWFEDPNKAETYRCRYGTTDKPLSECAVYAGLFTPGRIEVGAPYSDPMTGTWSGGQNAPTPDRQAMGQQVQNPAANYRSCDGMAVTGFDPVGFVMRPIQCALEWAFVPRPLVVEASFARADAEWDNKPPAVIAAAAESFALTPTASGCSRSVTLFGITFPILDVCAGSPMAVVADISKVVTLLGMVVLVLVVLKRQIAAMVNYNQGQG